jgi:hypothetical protein
MSFFVIRLTQSIGRNCRYNGVFGGAMEYCIRGMTLLAICLVLSDCCVLPPENTGACDLSLAVSKEMSIAGSRLRAGEWRESTSG